MGNDQNCTIIIEQVVFHDRYFLNRVVSKVIEIEHGSIMSFQGNYTAYAQKKQMIREAKLKEYLNQQAEIKHQEAVIEKLKSFNREKSIKRAESREKMLNKMERIEKPMGDPQELHFSLEPSCISGNDVLSVEGLSKSYGTLTLFQDVNFEIKRGEHVAVIGDNGTGNTTLLDTNAYPFLLGHTSFSLVFCSVTVGMGFSPAVLASIDEMTATTSVKAQTQ